VYCWYFVASALILRIISSSWRALASILWSVPVSAGLENDSVIGRTVGGADIGAFLGGAGVLAAGITGDGF
jgi:hypothetical protein